jgi:small subunit ribosomal protein S6
LQTIEKPLLLSALRFARSVVEGLSRGKENLNMRNYELIVIIQPDLDETAVTGVIEKVQGWISDSGGTVAKVDIWGKRRMAYAINKRQEGQYVLLEVNMKPTFSSELERNLRFLEPIMRYSLINRD